MAMSAPNPADTVESKTTANMPVKPDTAVDGLTVG